MESILCPPPPPQKKSKKKLVFHGKTTYSRYGLHCIATVKATTLKSTAKLLLLAFVIHQTKTEKQVTTNQIGNQMNVGQDSVHPRTCSFQFKYILKLPLKNPNAFCGNISSPMPVWVYPSFNVCCYSMLCANSKDQFHNHSGLKCSKSDAPYPFRSPTGDLQFERMLIQEDWMWLRLWLG